MKTSSEGGVLQRPIPAMREALPELGALGGASCEPVIMGKKARRAKPRNPKTGR